MPYTVFSDIGDYDADHPLANLIAGISVEVTGTFNHVYSDCPSAILKNVSVSSSHITYIITVSADIISEASRPIDVTISGDIHDVLRYTNDTVDISIYPSGITIPDGVYDTRFIVRLNNIIIHPKRSIIVSEDPGPGSIIIDSGYNVSVDLRETNLSITGSPGLGKGKYMSGGLDNLYMGVRSINGINIGYNVDVELSDALISDGGSV